MGQNKRHTGLSPYPGTRKDTLKWKLDVNSTISTSAVVGPKGHIYFATARHLYAVNASDGSLRWKYEAPDSASVYFSSSPTISSNGNIYIGTSGNYTGGIQAIRASDGTHRWTYEIGKGVRTSPVVGHRGNVYVGTNASSEDSTLYALDASDGSLQWRFNARTPVTSSPAIGPDGTVYVAGEDLYALDPGDGSRLWTFNTKGSAHQFSPVIDSSGTLYQSSGTELFYALSSEDGTQKWKSSNGSGAPSIGPQGDLYLSMDHGIKALETSGGTLKWKTDTIGIQTPSGPTIGANGTIYIGSQDGKIYGVNTDDGKLQWEFNTHSDLSASPVISPRGTIYVGTTTFYQPASSHVTKERSAASNAFYAIGGTKQTNLPPSAETPNRVELQQNYPNPFNPTTQIEYSLPQASDVQLTVYDELGRRVATSVDGKQQAGQHSVTFNAGNLSSGVYIYRLKANGVSKSRKMLLVK